MSKHCFIVYVHLIISQKTLPLPNNNTCTFLLRLKFLFITALVHDLAECIVGDITPHCGITPKEKHRQEDEAMKKISELTGIAGDRMYDLYKVC